MPNVFSVPIFFIVFRETLEAVIIISVLLGIVEQIANTRLDRDSLPATESEKQNIESQVHEVPPSLPSNDDDASSDEGQRKKLLRKLRIQVTAESPGFGSNLTSPFFCAIDFHWLWSGSVDRSHDRCRVHRRLVHQSREPMGKV